jgi:4-amino-4-deoxy-L-arabinose transferase-like glycosyltransferase
VVSVALDETRARRWVVRLFLAGVLLRVAAGLWRGADGFLENGYAFYLAYAENLLSGIGLCYAADGGCAMRMPFYPLWLTPFVAAGVVYPGVVIAQALVGASMTWLAWRLGRRLFDDRVGVMAAAAAALSPYAIVHDTALQDTVFVNVLVALAVVLLLRARAARSNAMWAWAGVALALVVLTNARMALLLPVLVLWAVYAADRAWRARLRAVSILLLPIVILVGSWMLRNWRLVGAPVLSTEVGESLWYGNNPWTFAHFPERSIDHIGQELMALPPEQRALIENFPGTEAQRDVLSAEWALQHMQGNPLATLQGAAQKLWVVLSAQMSPARSPLIQFGYAAVYLPLHVFSAIALWRSRDRLAVHSLVWLVLAAFAVTTAVFWAHTSHKSYLDVLIFVYASAGLMMVMRLDGSAGAPR